MLSLLATIFLRAVYGYRAWRPRNLEPSYLLGSLTALFLPIRHITCIPAKHLSADYTMSVGVRRATRDSPALRLPCIEG